MNNQEWPKVQQEAERQGWRIVETTDGYMLLAPNGNDKVMMHRIHRSSSPHALSHSVRAMRRHGFIWPPSKGA